MAKKTWISVKRRILDPKHQKAIGSAIWLFLYMLDGTDWKTGKVAGYTDKQASEELGIPKDTIIKHRRKLQAARYITCKKNDYDQTITIHKWSNPRKYDAEVINPPHMGATISGQSEQSNHERSLGSDQQSDQQTDQQSDHERSLSLKESSTINNQQSKKHIDDPELSAVDRAKAGTRRALEEHGIDPDQGYLGWFAPSMDQNRVDVSEFHEDVRTTIERFCRCWKLKPPRRRRKKGGEFEDWQNGGFELLDSCSEFGPDVIELVYCEGHWIKSDGTRFTISRPQAISKMVRSRAGELRESNIRPEELPPLIEHAKANAEHGQRLTESVEERTQRAREESGLKDGEKLIGHT
jgi:hypothetical protein